MGVRHYHILVQGQEIAAMCRLLNRLFLIFCFLFLRWRTSSITQWKTLLGRWRRTNLNALSSCHSALSQNNQPLTTTPRRTHSMHYIPTHTSTSCRVQSTKIERRFYLGQWRSVFGEREHLIWGGIRRGGASQRFDEGSPLSLLHSSLKLV